MTHNPARQVVAAREVPSPGLGFEGVPEDIGPDRVEAGGPDLLEPVGPVFPGNALVVDLSGHDPEGPAVEQEIAVAQSEGPLLSRQPGSQDEDGQDGE
jgi:hypothetical protein